VVPGTGIEPVRPLCRKAADFKSDVSTYFTTRAHDGIVKQKPGRRSKWQARRLLTGGATRSRTALAGFAIRCITALLSRQCAQFPSVAETCAAIDKKGKPGLPFMESGAGKESRTLDLNLGKVALYQLSYSRIIWVRL
jgi:hypothetical protein